MTELDEKTERLARLAKESGYCGILLTTQTNFAWLTGGRTNRIDGSREPGAGSLFVTADARRFVIANAIEMPRLLAEELNGGGWQAVEYPWTEEHAQPETVVRLAEKAAAGERVGADWPVAGAVPIDRPITRTRALLTSAEVERYLQLGADAGWIAGEVCRALLPGDEEAEIAARAAAAMATIRARAIVTLVAADDRIARFRHPVAGARRWERVVMVVLCVQRHGLIVSLSRIICAGRLEPVLDNLTKANATVYGKLLEATRPGARGAAIFDVVRQAYADARFPGEETRHHQGGATGYRTREWLAHPASEETVQARQAFAWNPSVTGTKVEETALLDENGMRIITSTPAWPSYSIQVGDKTLAAPGVLELGR
jgi:Xaa-Pro aminopeptidase